MSKITIDSAQLQEAYTQVERALVSLQLLLANLGCLHLNGVNVSTFDDKKRWVKKIHCPDCGITFEEELEKDELGL